MEETDNRSEEKPGEEEAATDAADAQTTEEKPPVEPGETAPPAVAPTQKTFPGQLDLTYQEALERIPIKKRGGGGILTLLMQPLLGALPHQVKKDLEAAVGNRLIFTAAAATGMNILVNLFVYPVVFMLVAVGINGVDVVFSQTINGFILLGLFIGSAEGFYRIKEGILKARPVEEMVLRGTFYGGPLSPLAQWFGGGPKLLREVPVPVEGFYDRGFVDKLERERRYGQVYTIEDLGVAYHLRLEFPRKVPEIALLANPEIPAEMPDYEYDLTLKDGHFIVKGKLTDEKVRRFCGGIGAFPGEFTTVIPLDESVAGFSHRFENKLLEVLLMKADSNGKARVTEQR